MKSIVKYLLVSAVILLIFLIPANTAFGQAPIPTDTATPTETFTPRPPTATFTPTFTVTVRPPTSTFTPTFTVTAPDNSTEDPFETIVPVPTDTPTAAATRVPDEPEDPTPPPSSAPATGPAGGPTPLLVGMLISGLVAAVGFILWRKPVA